jgi:5-methylcytosine-specific restriction protein A
MGILSKIQQGEILNNDQLREIFKCSPQGGMRRSLETNTLVIVSNHVQSIYDDRWIDDVFHYTGMGQNGNQSLTFAQNKTLAESNSNGVEVHLFEVEKEKEYIYQGQVILAGAPYQEIQTDASDADRQVVIFPLKLIGTKAKALSIEEFNNIQKSREQKVRNLSLDELKEKAIRARKRVGERTVQSVQYERDQYIAQFTRKRANGICDLCLNPAPFNDKNGRPYLESHHIEWLSKGGLDSIENTVALCPNCHRRMHILDDNNDRNVLMSRVHKKIYN